jgi:hypothetical protein
LKVAASQSYSIVDMFQRQQDLQLGIRGTGSLDTVTEERVLNTVRSSSPPNDSDLDEPYRAAAIELSKLLQLRTVQKRIYGSAIDPKSSFYLRHRMVLNFLWIYLRRDEFPGETKIGLAKTTALSFNRGVHTSRKIIEWTDSWVREQKIPDTRAGRHRHNFTWMDDEDVILACRNFIAQQSDSMYIMNFQHMIDYYFANHRIELTSYKLSNFVAEYLKENRPEMRYEGSTAEEINRAIQSVATVDAEDPTEYRKKPGITSRSARRWLNKLGYKWQEVKKGVFMDGHEREDVVTDRMKFLQKMQDLEPYLVDFDISGRMLEKAYPDNCQVGGQQRRPTILITHDESIFSANDGKRQAWIKESNVTFERPKGKGQGIMVSDFLLPWGRLNLLHLPEDRLAEADVKGVPLEAVELFEYGKREGYWDGACLLKQLTEKALPIAQFLYPGYDLVFMFDNATSHSIYAEDALKVSSMCKGKGKKQAFLRPGWYRDLISGTVVQQDMWTWELDPLGSHGEMTRVQKGIQAILEERGLWPESGLNVECEKPKCDTCLPMKKCRMCIKGTRCDSCKEPKIHSSKCSSRRQCDECVRRKDRCKCIRKKYCPRCLEIRENKCMVCEDLPPKCSTNSKL